MNRYRIVTRGELALGFTRAEVEKNLRLLCKYDPKTLGRVFSGAPFVFKSGLDQATAARYKQALDKTGIACSMEEDAAEDRIEMVDVRSHASPHAGQIPQNNMTCPKCGQHQPQAETCRSCAIVIAKYNQRSRIESSRSVDSATDRQNDTASSVQAAIPMRLILIILLGVGAYFAYVALFGPSRDVIVYTISDCEPCAEIVSYLQDQELNCTVYDIEESNDRTREYVRKSGGKNKIPLAFIGDIRVEGINPALYQIAVAKYRGTLQQEAENSIVMYSSSTCGYCKQARKFFESNQIAFTEYDIGVPANRDAYLRNGGIGTPLILIGNDIRIVGFDRKALNLALSEAGMI